MPPTVGHVAVNSRYLHRQGVDSGAIAAAVALSQIVNVATTVPLLVVIGVLTGSGVSRFKIVPGTDVVVGLACIIAVLGILAIVAPTRAFLIAHIWRPVRTAAPRLLEAISQPLRMTVGVAANLLLTSSYVLALYAALLAVGTHPPLLATAAVFLAGNTVGSIAPTPGGLGAVEAVMTAGLTAIGIPAHEAIPSVLLFRVATFWLPIPAGWVSYLVLERNGTL
jgi:glycosyltransferase 2 family protein